jgi:hypothetical protein
MRQLNRRRWAVSLSALLVLALSCSEANRTKAPVELVATTTQDVMVIDLLNPPATALGTIMIQAIQKGTVNDPTFLDVKLKSYRISYRRTDGGTLVPASFVRTTSGIVPVGGTGQSLNDVVIFNLDALNQAPFAALLPQNGGRDPETGQPVIKMDVTIEIFGETLAGDNVAARARIPLWFCAGCQG